MIIGYDANEANVEKRVGSGQYAFEILKHMADQTRDDTLVIYLKNPPRRDFPHPNEHLTYTIFGPKPLWTQIALPFNLYTSNKAHVFFSPAHYAPRKSPVPSVVTVHDLSYLKFPELFLKKDLKQLTQWTAYSVKNAAHIIVPSRSTKNDVISHYNCSATKVTVIPHGYNAQRFHNQLNPLKCNQIKQKYGLPKEYLLYLGTIQPRKNITRLLEAYRKLVDEGSRVPLVITGKRGWLYEDIFAKVDDLRLREHVIYTDYVHDEDVPYFYAGATLYVNPSLYEGFGMPVLEAMACGTLVAVSNNSSLPEVVGPGFTFYPEDIESMYLAIIAALKLTNEEKKKKQEEGLGFVNQFSWERAAAQTLVVLRDVAKQSG